MPQRRIIPRSQISQAQIAGIIKQACVQFVDNNPDATSEVAFLTGAVMALKVVCELDVPWLARNQVNDAAEDIGKEAIRRRDR